MTDTSAAAPPQPPRYPSLPDDVVQEVDDSEYTSGTSNYQSGSRGGMNSSTMMTDDSSSYKSPNTKYGVPKVPLPVSSGKSRLRSLLMWEDRKLSGAVFTFCMLFFYMTLWKGLSILSVIGSLMFVYLCAGLLITQLNSAFHGPIDKYIKKPPRGEMFFRRDVVEKWADTIMDIGNAYADDLRDVIYCDDPRLTLKWISISIGIYLLGMIFSPMWLLFLGTICAFSLPLAYERNKKQVDQTVQRAKEVSTQKAREIKEVTQQKAAPYLEKAHPMVKQTAEKMGITPQRKTATSIRPTSTTTTTTSTTTSTGGLKYE